ncbi:MAG TPA: hypothetical protein VKV25_10550, partial [Acidimicrobiales bacterium]|nr:hypothetical protein [Acidimicrobiales bacterium]
MSPVRRPASRHHPRAGTPRTGHLPEGVDVRSIVAALDRAIPPGDEPVVLAFCAGRRGAVAALPMALADLAGWDAPPPVAAIGLVVA